VEGINGHSDLMGIEYSGNVTNYISTADPIEDFTIYKVYKIFVAHVFV
jgi:hypothetical protein